MDKTKPGFNKFHLRRWLAFPFQGNALSFVLLSTAVAITLYGIAAFLVRAHPLLAWLLLPAWLALAYFLSAYCFRVMEDAAAGLAAAPAVEAELVTGFSLNPALKLSLLIMLFYSLTRGLDLSPRGPAGQLISLLGAALLPAMIAVLALEGRLLRAVDPRVLLGLILGLGWAYPWLMILTWAALALPFFFLASGPGFALGTLGALLSLLLVARLMGELLYYRREKLGLEPRHSPEKSAELEFAEEIRRFKDRFDEIHILSQAGGITEADGILRSAIAAARDGDLAYRWFFEELKENRHERLALLLGRDYLEILLGRRDHDAALDVCGWCMEVQHSFRPAQARQTLLLARAARDTGRWQLAAELLLDLGHYYPGDPEIPAALLEEADIRVQRLGEPGRARELLDQLAREYPKVVRSEAYSRLRRLLGQSA